MIATHDLAGNLRQMLAALELERQALAAMDVDALLLASQDKDQMCSTLEASSPAQVDNECHGLLQAARHQNEVNRKIRNLLAANVSARLEALTQAPGLYAGPKARRA